MSEEYKGKIHKLNSGTIYEGDWMTAPLAGGYNMSEIDGPYGCKKAAWDMMNMDGLAAWYRPHLARVTALSAPSSSSYLWNTAAGWARLDPEMRALGWTFRSLIVWNKGMGALAGRLDTEACRTWPDVTEVCGFYQREEWAPSTCAGSEIAYAAGRDERNQIRTFLCSELERSGMNRIGLDREVFARGGPKFMFSRHFFAESQWAMPTWEHWQLLHKVWNEAGKPEGRPYMQQGDYNRILDLSLPDDVATLRTEYDHLRAAYEASRPLFTLPMSTSNVWSHPVVAGPERLKDAKGDALHPCQKPLLFAERMVQASTRPGARILIPFGGTCRIATYLERLKRMEPENARYYDCAELNQDGRDYLGAVLGRMGEDAAAKAGQTSLLDLWGRK